MQPPKQDQISFLKSVSCLLFAGVLPLWPILSSLALIPLIALHVFFPGRSHKSTRTYQVLFFAMPFLAFAFSWFFSVDKLNATGYLLRLSPMLVMPLVLVFSDKEALPSRRAFMTWFIYGVIISSLFAFLMAYFSYLRTGDAAAFTYYALAENLKLHPTYYSLFALTAIHFLWEEKYYLGFRMFGTAILIILIFLLQTKIAYILLLVLLLQKLLWFRQISPGQKAFIAFIMIGFSFVVIRYSNRFTDDLKGFDGYEEGLIGTFEENGISQRMWLFTEAMEQIKDKPIFGYGLKSQRSFFSWEVHKKGLKKEQSFVFREAAWNASKLNLHNQYLHVLYEGGIFGLFLFLTALVGVGVFGIRARNLAFLVPFFTFLAILATENLLDRQMGIYFFSVFLPLLFLVRDKPVRKLIIKYNAFKL